MEAYSKERSIDDYDARVDTARKPLLLVQESMSVLARRIRVDQKMSATAIDPRLTTFGYKLIVALREHGSMNASDAADLLGVDRSVVSRHLNQSKELGLITSSADEQDGRKRLLALTDLAARRLDAQERNELTRLQRALIDWPDDDLVHFATYLQRLIRSGSGDGLVD
jgi:DNA-binding MarR family transcriptional regulator